MKELIRNILNEELNNQQKQMIKRVWDSQKKTTLIPKINWVQLKKMRLWDPQEFGSEDEIVNLYNDYLNLNEEERYKRFDIEFTGQELDETFLIKNGFQTNDKFKFNISGIDRTQRNNSPYVDVEIHVGDLYDFEIFSPAEDGYVTSHEEWQDDDDYWEWDNWFRGSLESIFTGYLEEYGVKFTDVYVSY
jgi:hypothetical protein